MRAFYSSRKFRQWLANLSPHEELVTRMALRDDIRDPGVSKWDARIAELQKELIRSEDDWVKLLPAVTRARRMIGKSK